MKIIKDLKEIAYLWKHRNDLRGAMQFHGHVETEHWRDGELLSHDDQGTNTFTTEGMTAALDILFRAQTTWAAVYCGIFLSSSVTPALANTAAVHLGAAGTYDEGQDAAYTPATNRPAYTVAAAAASAVTNTASKASFTAAADDIWYGAFLATSQAKTATTGVLICAKKFTAARTVVTADVINVLYEITASTS